MTTGQAAPAPFYCPRCGGLMYKPQGSSFYWHADYNHPSCEITNIAEFSKTKPVSDAAPDEAPRGRPRKREH